MYRAARVNNLHEVAVVKIVDKSTLRDDPNKLIRIKREIEILRLIDHPHLVKLLKVFEDDRFVKLVLRHCRGISLNNVSHFGGKV